MPRTEIDTDQILDGEVRKHDLNTTTVGDAVITRFFVSGLGLVLTETGADSGTGEVTLELGAGNFGTEYYSFESPVESTTTSNLWVQKALFTTPIIPAGKYIIHYRAKVTNTSKKEVGFQVNYQEDLLGFNTIEESRNAPVTADVYETRAAFDEISILNDNILDIQINYGQTLAGGTAKIKDVVVYLFKVGEL